jgi:hypothetical protein
MINRIIKLYKTGRSAAEIGESLGIPWRRVIYLMDKYNIKRRTLSEAIYCKHNPGGDPFSIKENLSSVEERLKILALGLYLNEGSKSNSISVRLSNSNPTLVNIFIKFLKIICGVRSQKIKFLLTLHHDTQLEQAQQYWSRQLDIPLAQLNKSAVVNQQGNGTYKKKAAYGALTVCVHNMKLRKIIQNWVSEYSRGVLLGQGDN